MDRIYTANDSDVIKFINYAEQNGWMYKYKQNCDSLDSLVFKYKGQNILGEVIVNLDKADFDQYPFLDTINCLNRKKKYLSNVPFAGVEYLNDTEGNAEECFSCNGSGIEDRQCPKCDGEGEIDCPKCDGSGDDCKKCDSSGRVKCKTCDGTGKDLSAKIVIKDNDGNILRTFDADDGCDFCEGSGKDYKGDSCNFCNGKGKIGLTPCKKCNGEKRILGKQKLSGIKLTGDETKIESMGNCSKDVAGMVGYLLLKK